MTRSEMRKLIRTTIKEIDNFNKDITILQIEINKLSQKNYNRYFMMCNDIKLPYENYTEAVHVSSSKIIFDTCSIKNIQKIISNTKKTLEKFMMLREL